MQPELMADCSCETGEGPLWHPDEQQLYWTDIPRGRLFRYDPHTHRHEQFYEGEPVGAITVQADGALLLFKQRGAVGLWRAGHETVLVEEIPRERETRFNDAIADPAGRVFAGTMPTGGASGRLYRLDPDGALQLMFDELGLPNGMGFSPDRTRFYLTDSRARRIYCFDYDQVNGDLMNREVFVEVPDREGEGRPDGLTVDAEGGVWSARWGGGCVVRYHPEGTEDHRVRIPIPRVSSAAFGGDDYADLYVTTAGGSDGDAGDPPAGALFRVRPGVNGVPEYRSRVLVDAGL